MSVKHVKCVHHALKFGFLCGIDQSNLDFITIINVVFCITEPMNTFHGTYKTDNDPIRLSYHANVHYNSVVDPYKATVGV